MPLRPFQHSDLDPCIDMYLDFVNALEHGDDDAWTENAVAERLKGILESPVFAGFVLEEGGALKGFLLGAYYYSREGTGYEILEIFSASGQNIQQTAARLLNEASALLKEKQVQHIQTYSSRLWDGGFFNAQGFTENPVVRLFEKNL